MFHSQVHIIDLLHTSTQDATCCYLGLTTNYLAGFKAAQLDLRAANLKHLVRSTSWIKMLCFLV